jgi:hypothetical protein
MATIASVEQKLKSLGYTSLKTISGSRTAILTNEDRTSLLEKVAQELKEEYNAVYNPSYATSSGSLISSTGVVVLKGNILILAKPASRQGGGSAGLDNEDRLVNEVNKYINNGWGSITVIFSGSGKKEVVSGVTKAESVGADTVGRKKSDVNLITSNGAFPISIKKANAEYWESADRIWGAKAKAAIDFLVERGDIGIKQVGGIYTFENNVTGIAIPATDLEKTDFVFGSDLLGKGIVVKETFNSGSFSWDENTGTLKVNCKKIFKTLQDVKSSTDDVYLLIRKDRTRKNPYPGMRVLATYKSRAHSGSVKVFSRSKFGRII